MKIPAGLFLILIIATANITAQPKYRAGVGLNIQKLNRIFPRHSEFSSVSAVQYSPQLKFKIDYDIRDGLQFGLVPHRLQSTIYSNDVKIGLIDESLIELPVAFLWKAIDQREPNFTIEAVIGLSFGYGHVHSATTTNPLYRLSYNKNYFTIGFNPGIQVSTVINNIGRIDYGFSFVGVLNSSGVLTHNASNGVEELNFASTGICFHVCFYILNYKYQYNNLHKLHKIEL